MLYGASAWFQLQEDLAVGGGLVLKVLRENLIDLVWTEQGGRPVRKRKSIVGHPLEYAGRKWEEKVTVVVEILGAVLRILNILVKMAELRETMEKQGLYAMVVSEEDEIAWLFNLRGEGDTTNKVGLHALSKG